MRSRVAALVSALSVGLVACGGTSVLMPPATSSPTPTTTTTTSVAPTSTTTTTRPPRDCDPAPGRLPAAVDERSPTVLSILLSESTFPCADEVVIAAAGNADGAAVYAATVGAPLLLSGGSVGPLAGELDRLDPAIVTVAAGVDPADPALAGRQIRPLPAGGSIASGVVQASGSDRLLVVAPAAAAAWPAVWAAARAAGDTAVLTLRPDLRSLTEVKLAALRSVPEAAVTFLGPTHGDAGWELEVVRRSHELPGGGLLLFPDRRLVAFYGHPETPVLGVLGEQGPNGVDATLARLAPIAASYATPGTPAVPALEIIATVASAEATGDGDYSRETSPDVLRPWIEAAGEQGAYVILDLQPGRTDFLTQARLYEEFLRLPHVGLAIDPEWRLQPHQVHLRQIGHVEAAEINTVAEYLAGLVREEALPQKLLLLHQFQLAMIPDRDQVEFHPELAIVVQMDGQGPLATKYGTWRVLTTEPDAGRYWWGWKSFYDEDLPVATPAEVLALEPAVSYVSFQ